MTEKKPPATSSGDALCEAQQNIRAAEQLFDAGALDKAYAAAFIANSWTMLGGQLLIREGAERWDNMTSMPLDPDPVTDTASPVACFVDAHKIGCTGGERFAAGGHGWFVGDHESAVECHTCGVLATEEIKYQQCPGPPDPKHTHGAECAHRWRVTVAREITSSALCVLDCDTVYSDRTKDAACPIACSVLL
jgi:hypothetical protein